MSFERWIHQHPELLALFFPAYFLALWLGVGAIVSLVGGWFSLAKRDRLWTRFNGAKWGGQSAKMRDQMKYNDVLTIGASPQGLYLASMFLFVLCTLHS